MQQASHPMSKGSRQRPSNHKAYATAYDLIFRKATAKPVDAKERGGGLQVFKKFEGVR